jgi:transcriptional regulator with XRE-family HTH domain
MTSEERKEYGHRLLYMRLAAGLTQQDVGIACGFTGNTAARTVQHWEHGRRLPSTDRVRALATVLKVHVNQIVP